MLTQDLLREVGRNEKRLRARLRELVEIESPSGHPPGIENAIKALQEWLKTHDCTLKRHKNRTFGDVLEVRFGPKRGQKPVLVLGHLDTVWPVGTLKSMPWRASAGRLHGPGVLDMKAGVVMAIEAFSALQVLSLQQPAILLLNSDEEIGSPFSRQITEKLALESSAVFVLEPAQGLAYKTARKGVGNYKLRVSGVASHAGVDFEKGHSAVREMSHLIQTISAFTDIRSGLTINVGTVSGGTRSNVIAAECSADIDVRLVKSADAKRIERMFRRLAPRDKACRIELSGGINRPPMERSKGTAALFHQARSFAVELGLQLEEASTGGGSDGNFTAALGVPTLDGMGAVGKGAHAPDEHVISEHLVQRTALLASMIATTR